MKKCGHKDGSGRSSSWVLVGGWVVFVGNNDDGGYGTEEEAKDEAKKNEIKRIRK